MCFPILWGMENGREDRPGYAESWAPVLYSGCAASDQSQHLSESQNFTVNTGIKQVPPPGLS